MANAGAYREDAEWYLEPICSKIIKAGIVQRLNSIDSKYNIVKYDNEEGV